MDFDLPEELRLLKENIRRFVDRELIPLEREVVSDVKLQKELPNRLRSKVEADPSTPRHLVTVRGLGYKFEG